MTIGEVLKANIGKEVRIGFGSCFVYCDTVTDKTFKELCNISGRYFELFEETRYRARMNVKTLEESGENAYVERYLKMQRENKARAIQEARAFRRPVYFNEKPRKYFIEQYKKELQNANALYKRADKAINKFVPFLDADATEVYSSITDFATIIISKDNPRVIGQYWSSDEYRRKIKVVEL